MLIDLIVGARPNFMKMAPIIEALRAARSRGAPLDWRLIHTGQHYDAEMSDNFFQELELPRPDLNLEAGSGTSAEQTAAIMVGYERALRDRLPEVCLVVGDVNSTMACAITAKKQAVRVAHVEAGIRSGDQSMPEEVNRLVTDAITDWFFTTSRTANQNLRRSGVPVERIFFVGNTMIDTLAKHLPRLRPPSFWTDFQLRAGKYCVLTLHRPANVDHPNRLAAWLTSVAECCGQVPVIFPVHPRTARRLDALQHELPSFRFVAPLPYGEFNYLVKHARAVITDSGGITEEATILGVPCMSLRNSTERPETVIEGTNELIGTEPGRLKEAFARLFRGEWKKGRVPELWDGKAAIRIVEVLVAEANRSRGTEAKAWATVTPSPLEQDELQEHVMLRRPELPLLAAIDDHV